MQMFSKKYHYISNNTSLQIFYLKSSLSEKIKSAYSESKHFDFLIIQDNLIHTNLLLLIISNYIHLELRIAAMMMNSAPSIAVAF